MTSDMPPSAGAHKESNNPASPPTGAPEPQKPFWTKLKIGAVLSVGLAAVTGFASPEVRQGLCLELPAPKDLKYAKEPDGSTAFSVLASPAVQPEMNGQTVRFRARWYGHAIKDVYTVSVSPENLAGKTVANLRPVDYVVQQTALGADSAMLPPFAALLNADDARRLAALPNSALVDFEGRARYLQYAQPGSAYAAGGSKQARSPDHADFFVDVSSITVLEPTNDPRDRALCRAFHGLEPEA